MIKVNKRTRQGLPSWSTQEFEYWRAPVELPWIQRTVDHQHPCCLPQLLLPLLLLILPPSLVHRVPASVTMVMLPTPFMLYVTFIVSPTTDLAISRVFFLSFSFLFFSPRPRVKSNESFLSKVSHPPTFSPFENFTLGGRRFRFCLAKFGIVDARRTHRSRLVARELVVVYNSV